MENFIPASSEENLRPLEMPDCIYLTERCRCGILNVKECLRMAEEHKEVLRKY